jgi:predicted NAD-dependent protein-ADP-ribosyltransferase YbiA (DUF1768 family)
MALQRTPPALRGAEAAAEDEEHEVFPCGVCAKDVPWNARAMQCAFCCDWFHVADPVCVLMPENLYEAYRGNEAYEQASWYCLPCNEKVAQLIANPMQCEESADKLKAAEKRASVRLKKITDLEKKLEASQNEVARLKADAAAAPQADQVPTHAVVPQQAAETQTAATDIPIRVVQGYRDPLSMFYVFNPTYKDMSPEPLVKKEVKVPSTEHILQLRKVLFHDRPDLAKQIVDPTLAPYARDAKRLGKIPTSDEWKAAEENDMMTVLHFKYENCPVFRRELYRSREQYLAHSLPSGHKDDKWSTSMDREDTMSQTDLKFPGQNLYGQLLMRLRDEKVAELSTEFDGIDLGPEPNILLPSRTGERRWADRDSQPRCYRCGEEGHLQATCTLPPGLRCYTCGDLGHKARDCLNNSPIMSGDGNAIKEPVSLFKRTVVRPCLRDIRGSQQPNNAHQNVATGVNAVPMGPPLATQQLGPPVPQSQLQQRHIFPAPAAGPPPVPQLQQRHIFPAPTAAAQPPAQATQPAVAAMPPLQHQQLAATDMSRMDARLDGIVYVVADMSKCIKTLSEFVHNNMLADQTSHLAAPQSYLGATHHGMRHGRTGNSIW